MILKTMRIIVFDFLKEQKGSIKPMPRYCILKNFIENSDLSTKELSIKF